MTEHMFGVMIIVVTRHLVAIALSGGLSLCVCEVTLLIPKPQRLVDPQAIERVRKDRCEVCGERANEMPHHIITRGAGGPDSEINLIQLCRSCHCKAHTGQLSKARLFEIVAERERLTSEAIQREINEIRYGVQCDAD